MKPVSMFFTTVLTGIGILISVNLANGLKCFKCAHSSVTIPVENYTFYEACDIDREPNSTFLEECVDSSTCVTVSNYKNSQSTNFVYRTCTDINIGFEGTCKNFTITDIKLIFQEPWTDLLESEVEVCPCKTDSCNWKKETKPSFAPATGPSLPTKSSNASNLLSNFAFKLLLTVFSVLVFKL